MERMRALIAVSRKLLRIIHAIVRNNRDYVEGYKAPEVRVIKKLHRDIIQAGRSSFSSIEALKRPPFTEYMTPRQHPNPN